MQLTTSEARVEAACIVLHVLIEAMTARQLAALYRRAKREAAVIGLSAIEEEVAWICRDDGTATADMLARYECD